MCNLTIRAALAAALLGASTMAAQAAVQAQTADALAVPAGCFKNDSVRNGKRLAPTPALIKSRQESPACRAQASPSRMIYDSPELLRELERLHQIRPDSHDTEIPQESDSSAV
jgi:hypothetical protein